MGRARYKKITVDNATKQMADGGPGAKLSPVQVREIRRRLDSGESCRSIGRAFGIHHSQISAIRRGVAWRNVK